MDLDRWTRHPAALPALAGLLLAAAYLLPALPTNFLALAPLLLWLDTQPAAGVYARLRAGFVFGLVFYGIGLHFFFALTRFSWLAILLWAGFSVAAALRDALLVAVLGWLRRRTAISWGVLLPLVWVPLERISAVGDLRMTGDHLVLSLARYPFLVQFADVVGPYGVAAFLLACNGLFYETMLSRERGSRRRGFLALATLVVTVVAYDAVAWRRNAPGDETVRVALVQPDIPLLVKRGSGTELEQWQALDRLTREAAALEPELIVWPESARPAAVQHWLDRPATFAMPETQALAAEIGIPVLVGVEYFRIRSRDDYELYNAALLVHADGTLDPRWTAKIYLVPFVEATPFRSLLGPLVRGRGGEWQWLAGGFDPGTRGVVLRAAGAPFGVLVCYEQLFPDLARDLRNAGARFQVVITNDAWFGRTFFQTYQANALRLRAIENRSAFVRCANTGISGFVDRRGVYHEQTPLFEQAVRAHDVALAGAAPVYDRLGDLILWPLALGLLWVLWLAARAAPAAGDVR